MKKVLIQALKLVLVALLFWWVYENVQWDDEVRLRNADGEVVETLRGSIQGAWDGDTVRLATGGTVRSFDAASAEGGRAVEVVPGFLTYLQNLDPLWFGLGAACYLVVVLVAAARWWWLLRVNRLDVSLGEAVRYTWIGVFFNNVVPGQTGGDIVKALYIVKRCPTGRVEALMSVIVDRILGLGSLALLGAIVVLFDLERFGLLAVAIWAVLLAVVGVGVFAFSRRLRRAIRLDHMLRRLPGRVAGPLMKVDRAIFFYRDHQRGVLLWMVVGVVTHGFTVLSFYLMGQALGIGVPALEYFALIPVILMVSAVPIAPNGWGIGEALFGTLFAKFASVHLVGEVADPVAVMRTRGIALSVLYRLHTTVWSLIGGVMLLFDRDRVTRAEFDAEVAREHAEDEALGSRS